MRGTIGVNPDLDYLLDLQQRDAAWYPRCGCCGAAVTPGRRYYELNVMGYLLNVCDECRGVMDINEVLVEA